MAVIFAPEPGVLGLYTIGVTSGLIAATLAASSPLFSFRWGNTSNLCIPDFISVGVTVTGVITTAVSMPLELIIARSFTASDSGGTAVTLTTNNAKYRTSFQTSLVTDARIATTGTLTAGTRTLDAQAEAVLPHATGLPIAVSLAATTLYNRTSLFPIVLNQDEGFIIRNQSAGPATGTFTLHVQMRWFETVKELVII
jgi:hypothetical protein